MPFTRRELARRDQAVVDRREPVGGDHQLVAEDVARAVAGQVEVAVVGQVDRRRLVGRRGVVDPQLVLVGQRVDDRDVEVARIAFLAVRAEVGQLQRRLRSVAGTISAFQTTLSNPLRPPCRWFGPLLAASL